MELGIELSLIGEKHQRKMREVEDVGE